MSTPGNYLLIFLLEPVYRPTQAAPAPTTIEIKPDCSMDGASRFMYHITHLYNNMIYVVMNTLGKILQLSTALARCINRA